MMFGLMFKVLEDTARETISFAHIWPEQGLRTISVDMCQKQAPGQS